MAIHGFYAFFSLSLTLGIYPLPLENLRLTSALIITAWLGWIFKSKAIWHYGKPHPEEERILRDYIIPSVIEAFEQGITKVIDDKIKEGNIFKTH